MNTKPIFRLTPLAAALLASFAAHAQLPTNPVLVNGAATINETATGLRVTNLPGTIINWDSFNIGTNRSVEFAQLSAGSAVMNRVTGNTRSEVLGALTSNGRVFLLNPNGVLFGNGARVDVQGLVASTLDLSNEDFLAGNYRFTCTNDVACDFSAPDALNPTRNRIVLQDGSQITTRTAGNGGQVWLIARGAVQTESGSRMDAPLGQVAIAAGREVTVTSPSLGAITFTLDRIAGSQIDLAGDIDVERGAAGFFADSIRFAGHVRVPSATDGAGQIVASAGTRIDVDDGARLNVSGDANADGGAVRLQATQTVRVAAAAEIAADGGDFTAAASGGAGGVITLEAAEVKLPGLLGRCDLRGCNSSPIQLHARGQDAAGLALARYGRIDVNESGRFEYEVIQGPTWLANSNASGNRVQTGVRSTEQSNSTRQDIEILGSAPAGDGTVLLVTAQREERSSLNQDSATGLFDRRQTTARQIQLHVLDAAGALVTSLLLQSDSTTPTSVSLPERSYEVLGLTQGGWVVRETAVVNQSRVAQLLFVDARGVERQRLDASLDTTLRALLGGGVLLTTPVVNGTPLQSVFDARGVLMLDTAAALVGENFANPLRNGSFSAAALNFDERRRLRTSAEGSALERVDLATDLIERSAALPVRGDLLASVNGTALVLGGPGRVSAIGNDTLTSTVANDIVAVDGQMNEVLLSISGSSVNVGGVTNSAAPLRSNSDMLTQHGSLQVLDSRRIGVVTTTRNSSGGSRLTSVFTPLPSGNGSSLVITNTSSSNSADSVSFNQISRQLAVTPFASQTAAGSYLAAIGGSTPGLANGSLSSPMQPSTPPVTPPSTPSATPPSTPAVTPPSGGGVTLEIRPPQTVVPPLGHSAPTPPSTTRPRGPSTVDVGGTDKEVLEAAAKAEADLVRELVCSELSAADCLKFDTGMSDIQQDLVDKVTRKQLSGPYWEVIEDMAVPTIHALFEAIGDLQTSGELDEELRGGLDDALFERPIGPDGQPGDSALDRTLGVYDLLVKQAKTPAEKEQLRRDFAEDLLDAAQQQVASKAPPKAPPPPPPGADVTNDSIIADEAQIQADVKAQNDARAAEAAAEAATQGAPAPAP